MSNEECFKPFQSLIGERKAGEFIDKYAKCKTIVTEKIHGCNFSVYLNNDGEIWFASRNHILEKDSNLFNFRSYFTKEKCDNLSKLAKDILHKSGFQGSTLRFIGELFGNKIQREIKYCENVDFNVFYIELDNKSLVWSDEEEKNMMTVKNLSTVFNFTTVPVIAVGCLDEMYSLEIGFSQIATNSICEGYCYRVVDICEADNGEDILPIILKKRSKNYLETIKEFSEDDDIVQQIRLCITRQRILNILSKGFRGKINVTKLTFLMWKDIFNEFNDTAHGPYQGGESATECAISKNFQKKIQKLYRNEAEDVITQILQEQVDDDTLGNVFINKYKV